MEVQTGERTKKEEKSREKKNQWKMLWYKWLMWIPWVQTAHPETKKDKKPLREVGGRTISFLVLSVHAVQPPTGENQLG